MWAEAWRKLGAAASTAFPCKLSVGPAKIKGPCCHESLLDHPAALKEAVVHQKIGGTMVAEKEHSATGTGIIKKYVWLETMRIANLKTPGSAVGPLRPDVER